MSLYRTYRPKNLEDMVGQQHILDVLRAQARAGKFSHNYILYGPKGTGKTTTARLIAKLTTATTPNAWEHLSDDPVSALIDSGKTVDYVEIDAASHTGVDNIKDEIISKALYPPSQLRKKIYVIDEVHMLSKGAFNALLKIMEEPPEYLVFILATTEIHKVPDTIISRCQVFQFKQLPVVDIATRLAYIAEQEHITYEPEALALIAKLANGGVRDAIKYLEQLSMIGNITVEAVTTFLGVVSQATLQELLNLIVTKQSDALAQFLDKLAGDGVDLLQCIKDLLLYLDEHFMEDPMTYASLAQVGSAILADGRYYPQPMIIIKMHLRQRMQGNGATMTRSETTPNKVQNTSTPEATSQGFIPEATSKGLGPEATSQGFIPEATSQGPEVAPKLTVTKTPAVAPTLSDATPQQAPLTSARDFAPLPPVPPTASSIPDNTLPLETPSQAGATHESLMEQLIARVDKTMVKSILKKSSLIARVTDDLVEMTVINEQYCGMLNNTDTRTYLEGELSTILGRPIRLLCVYKSKETYLQEQMI